MSGASGKVPAAIHLTPEAALGGPISKLKTGDIIELDAHKGTLNVELPEAELAQRTPTGGPASNGSVGRSFFDAARLGVGNAEQGASFLFPTKSDR
jgi:phosphogluconate dehydratase